MYEEHEITCAPGGGHTHLEIDLPASLPLAQQSLHYPWVAAEGRLALNT